MKTHSILKNKYIVYGLAIFCNALWGSAFPSIKIGYRLFQIPSDDPASQILFAGMRFFLAGILAVVFGSFLQRKPLVPKKASLPVIVKLSVFQTVVQYVFFYLGLANTAAVKGSIIAGSNTFAAILAASFLFHQEKLTKKKMAACIIGFAGVVLVNLNGGGISMSIRPDGEGFLLISVASFGIASCLLKIYSEKEDPVILSGYQFITGGFVMMAAGAFPGGQITCLSLAGIGVLIYLAFISSAAFSIWGILLKHYPVSRIAIFGFMNPVFGVLLSALILHEKSQAALWKIIIALLLVCTGICLVNVPEKKQQDSL